MIVTEEEAKIMRCQESFGPPSAELQMYYPVGAAAQMSPSHCIGSACMAWRWRRENLYVVDPLDATHFTEHRDAGDLSTTHGYCGKAGKP